MVYNDSMTKVELYLQNDWNTIQKECPQLLSAWKEGKEEYLEMKKQEAREAKQRAREEAERAKEEAREAKQRAKEEERARKKFEEGCRPIEVVEDFIRSLRDKGLKPLFDELNQNWQCRKTIEAYNPNTGKVQDVSDDWENLLFDEWKFCSSSTEMSNRTNATKHLIARSIKVIGKSDPTNAILMADGNVLSMNGPRFEICSINDYLTEHECTFFAGNCESETPDIEFLNSTDFTLDYLPNCYFQPLSEHLDRENIEALMQCTGNIILPQTSGGLRMFSLWIGPKRTGKSQWGKFLEDLLPGLINKVNFCSVFDSAKFATGTRFVQQELPDMGIIPSDKFKADSSGESRELNIKCVKNNVQTRGCIACVLGTNTFPTIEAGAAVEDRLQIISFRNSFSGVPNDNIYRDGTERDKLGLVATALLALRSAKINGVIRPAYNIAGLGADSANPLEKWLSDDFDRSAPCEPLTLGQLCNKFVAWINDNAESHEGYLSRSNGQRYLQWTTKGVKELNQLLRRLGCKSEGNCRLVPLKSNRLDSPTDEDGTKIDISF